MADPAGLQLLSDVKQSPVRMSGWILAEYIDIISLLVVHPTGNRTPIQMDVYIYAHRKW